MGDNCNEYDTLKDNIEFQENMYNPGHWIATGRVPPTVSANGNSLPLAVFCFVFAIGFLIFGLFLFFSDAQVTSVGIIESETANKVIALIIMTVISLVFLWFGFIYLKKAKKYYKLKAKMQSEPIDNTVEDRIWQRVCPKCKKSHDMDYPKCPYCKFDYRNM